MLLSLNKHTLLESLPKRVEDNMKGGGFLILEWVYSQTCSQMDVMAVCLRTFDHEV